MNEERAFHQAMLANPNDLTLRIVFADWLEECGDPRGELLRLTHTLTQTIDMPRRAELEARMQALVDEGVQAVGPFWTNSLGIRFAWIPAGTFLMGMPKSEEDELRRQFGNQDWGAHAVQHQVTLTKGFFLGIHPVTQGQWQAVMGQNPSAFKGENLPVESVSWLDAVTFCINLSKKEVKRSYYEKSGDEVSILGGEGFRLATEAQWEYACRGGSTTTYCFGSDIGKLGEYAWYADNASETTHPVGQKKPNAWGLYDMHGNIFEWCEDWYDHAYYNHSPNQDPENRKGHLVRVIRGGDYYLPAESCSASGRNCFRPSDASKGLGFRLLAVSSSPVR